MLNFDAAFQSQVIVAALDDFTPNAVLPNLHGGQYGDSPGAWREAVIEFIRSMLSAGLIAPLPGRGGYDSKNTQEICEILLFG
ncbi:hypothetical protein, partial [Chitinimonas sp. JJ19]|uniref:hypothetical protein n=1 Tax=Chitinimonas sp. JJ19 TaxID=3109352 RepID=UPI003001B821